MKKRSLYGPVFLHVTRVKVRTRTVHRYRSRARPDILPGHVAQTLADDARGVLAPTSGARERAGSLLPAADMGHEAQPAEASV